MSTTSNTMTLSPFTRQQLSAPPPSGREIADRSGVDPARYVRYQCPACNDLHHREDDAEYCCPRRVHKVYQRPDTSEVFSDLDDLYESFGVGDEEGPKESVCPVCFGHAESVFGAADCCLWRDLHPTDRFRIAWRVIRGMSWADAIAAGAQ